MKSKLRSVYIEEAARPQLDCGGPDASMTHQEFRDECDINNIMKRFERSGMIDHVNSRQGDFGDFSEVPDYQSALNAVMDAEEAFMGLDARLRDEFGNDPGEFLTWFEGASEDDKREKGLLPEAVDAEVEGVAGEGEGVVGESAGGEAAPPAAGGK